MLEQILVARLCWMPLASRSCIMAEPNPQQPRCYANVLLNGYASRAFIVTDAGNATGRALLYVPADSQERYCRRRLCPLMDKRLKWPCN